MGKRQPLDRQARATIIKLILSTWATSRAVRRLAVPQTRINPMLDDLRDIRSDIEKAFDDLDNAAYDYLRHFRVKREARRVEPSPDFEMLGYRDMLSTLERFASTLRDAVATIEAAYGTSTVYVRERSRFVGALERLQRKVFETIAERRCMGEQAYADTRTHENGWRQKDAAFRARINQMVAASKAN